MTWISLDGFKKLDARQAVDWRTKAMNTAWAIFLKFSFLKPTFSYVIRFFM